MRLTDAGLDAYLTSVAGLLDRYGLEVAGDALAIEEAPGVRRLDLRALLPGGSSRAGVEVRETWVEADAGAFERTEYVYELLDHERDFRRAFHLHDPEWFAGRFLVVVHEHCENPLGLPVCDHYEGTPIRDAFAGILALMDSWAGEPPDCSTLRCLE